MDFNDAHPVDKQRLFDLRDALRALPDAQALRDARILTGVLARRYRSGDDSHLDALIGRLRTVARSARGDVFAPLALSIIVGVKARAA